MMSNSKIYEKISIVLILIFAMVILVSCLLTKEYANGEWDDYLFTTASLLNDHNMTISNQDIDYGYEVFPETRAWNQFSGSSFSTSSGEILPWYFGTYSAACIPMVIALRLLRLPTIYAFSLTNILIYLLALYCVYRKLRISAKARLILLLLLMLNPAVFYIIWISAEVFIFSIIIIAMIHWTNQEYWQAAIFISVASTLNPTVLAIAPMLTIDFTYYLKGIDDRKGKGFVNLMKIYYKQILMYCLCYSIAMIPFAYNIAYTGHINLTIAIPAFHDDRLLLPRFWAYLTDLNFGFLPYFGLAFLLSILGSVIAAIKRSYRCMLMMLGFLCVVLGYSFMAHINSGMSGIARYNGWSSPIMLFCLAVYYEQLFEKKLWKRVVEGMICISLLWTGYIVYSYGLMGATRTSYICMTPIAKKALYYCPSIYNPLPSTFNSRIKEVDGGYQYQLPVFYVDDEDHVRKILASKSTCEDVLANVTGSVYDMKYLEKILSTLDDSESYISIDLNHYIFLSE